MNSQQLYSHYINIGKFLVFFHVIWYNYTVNSMIDLHTHSNASDGSLSPTQLIEKAAFLGLKALALTDHDTVSGLEEAELAVKSTEIRFIRGVELEILSDLSGEFHLLGLGLRTLTDEFHTALENLAGTRERRNLMMVEKIRSAGIDANYEEIKAFAGTIVARPHFGAFLISRKLVKNQEQAFKRWLGKGRPFYVPKEGLEISKAARIIHECGGAAILAHPMSLHVSWGRLPGLIVNLKEQGLDGIEAWHPTARVTDCKRLEKLGLSLGLFISAGSDFHGSVRPERKLGFTAGDRKITDDFLFEGLL